jgi:hypothetical protein
MFRMVEGQFMMHKSERAMRRDIGEHGTAWWCERTPGHGAVQLTAAWAWCGGRCILRRRKRRFGCAARLKHSDGFSKRPDAV